MEGTWKNERSSWRSTFLMLSQKCLFSWIGWRTCQSSWNSFGLHGASPSTRMMIIWRDYLRSLLPQSNSGVISLMTAAASIKLELICDTPARVIQRARSSEITFDEGEIMFTIAQDAIRELLWAISITAGGNWIRGKALSFYWWLLSWARPSSDFSELFWLRWSPHDPQGLNAPASSWELWLNHRMRWNEEEVTLWWDKIQ